MAVERAGELRPHPPMQLVAGHTPDQLPVVRELFVEYANALGVDFCFQNFDRELAGLPESSLPQ